MASNVVRIFERSKADNMIGILNSYGIESRRVSVLEEQNFDIYDIKLERGTRVSKLDRILIDIGMELGSYVTPTGMPVVRDGVYRLYIQNKDIPSEDFSPISSLIKEGSFHDMIAPISLGIDMHNDLFVVDLCKIPNLLIGGVPGSGKSMVLHSIILSLLAGGNVDLYLSDPKNVEFSLYEDLGDVKTISYSIEDTRATIDDLISIMNNRFVELRKNKVRSFDELNSIKNKVIMKPIVLIIDEWADLYFRDKKIQNTMCILAQKGRAAGISVIIATQRPSAQVVSGLIKASFSGRMCLKTSSAIDSRIVIDHGCADGIEDVGVGYYKDQNHLEPKVFRSFYIESINDEIDRLSIRRPSFISKVSRGVWG